MGIVDALNNAVSGLRAQSFAFENISGNIANSQTTGFKRLETSFEDMIPDGDARHELAGSVSASSRATNTVQGTLQNVSNASFMAIKGDGFFVVQKPASGSSSTPTFDGVDLYTRRGDFQTDANGYLVNGAGYYLMGYPGSGAAAAGNVPQLLQFKNDFAAAAATKEIQYRANLASVPATGAYSASVSKSELLDPTAFTSNPLISGTGTVIGSDVATFTKQTISGGAVTAYDASGTPVDVQLRWAKTDSAASGGTDTWQLFYQENASATGTSVAWRNAGTSFAFDAGGQLSPAISSVPLTNLTVNGTSLGSVAITLGSGGLTQFADANGVAQVNLLQQDGYPAGRLQSVSVDDKGRIVGNYSNGRTTELAQVALADFSGPERLRRLDGGAFAATDDSGAARLGATGTIVGSSLEASNTDIADEFTKIIVTQQAYSANTRVVTTSNQMVQDLLNMLR